MQACWERDSSLEWLTKYLASRITTIHDLPALESLASFVDQQTLPVKIPLPQPYLTQIRNHLDWRTPPDVVDSLFVQDDHAPAMVCYDRMVNMAVHAIDSVDYGIPTTTANSFHVLWDMLLRAPLQVACRDGRFDRNCSATESTRPDLFFCLDSVCVFRGQEAAAGVHINTPREQLRSKMLWVFGDQVPYVFAYVASGYHLLLLAMTPVDRTCSIAGVEFVQLAEFHLEHVGDRLRLLRSLLQMGRLVDAIASHCAAKGRCEYVDLQRESGEMVWLSPLGVQKDFSRAWATTNFDRIAAHVETVYTILSEHYVPHVGELVRVSRRLHVVTLEPRGVLVKPRTLVDLFCALRCVLEALVALHGASWMHRDIRWPNVLQQQHHSSHPNGQNDWFVIDFLDAASSPQRNGQVRKLSTEEHAPEMSTDFGSHTTAVDLWSVGFLIETCAAFEHWEDFGPRTALKNRLLSTDPQKRPTAEEALQELVWLEEMLTSQEIEHQKEKTMKSMAQ